uniref:TBC1 domain family member 24 n=1 Tax=Sinocyclocheilus anshuiensis TaxID=1608454 RepID=A0A671MQA0_9TELE
MDNWEISSSGMKYGQYVDWKKIDPDPDQNDHYELKAMGRTGFWSMPHTLRAKAYPHIIHSIESTSTSADVDTYHGLVGKIFGEFQTSTHPFPKFMENGEIPRYCLNKAGLNSVKKILICINQCFPTGMPFSILFNAIMPHFEPDHFCFHSICSLVSYTDPKKRYIDQTFLISHASCMTFGDLANKYCRGIWKLIASSHQNLFEFYSDWIMWIFADLPFTYAIRVLDVYLMEGYKALYHVALALLSLYKVSVQDMKNFVQNVGRHSTIDTLLRRAFRSCPHMRVVWAWIPERFALFSPVQLFATNVHGRSLENTEIAVFLLHFDLLMLGLMATQICGAFLSSDWAQKNCDEKGFKFFGTGECFVFTVSKSTFAI